MSSRTEERSGTRGEIMEATYHALQSHGYADLTIQDIADEFGKSKSLLYYHYESKDALLVDFLDYLLERFVGDIEAAEADDPDAQLRCLLDRMLPADPPEEAAALRVALLELRAQAPHDDAFREQFRKSDRVLRDTIADHLRAGIETGAYREMDVEREAEFVHAAINGTILRGVTLGEQDENDHVRAALDAYLDDLLTDAGTDRQVTE